MLTWSGSRALLADQRVLSRLARYHATVRWIPSSNPMGAPATSESRHDVSTARRGMPTGIESSHLTRPVNPLARVIYTTTSLIARSSPDATFTSAGGSGASRSATMARAASSM